MTVPMEEFEGRVKDARARLEGMQSREDVASGELLPELQLAVEELHVAHEELHVQQEHLLAAQQAVDSERHRYQVLFAGAPAALILTDRDGMVREVNEAAAQLLGLDPLRLPTTSIFSHLEVGHRSTARRLLLRTVAGQSATMQARLTGPEKREVELRISVADQPAGVMWLLTTGAEDTTPLSSAREVRLVELVADMTASMAEDFDVIETLTQVCEQLTDTMGLDACGVLLADGERVEVAAVSGPEVEEVEFVQLQVGDGPCLEALRRNEVIVVDGTEAMRESWPAFADACAEVDLVSVAAFPLAAPNGPLGTLNVFRRTRAGFAPHDLRTCQALARVMVLAITHAQAFHDTQRQAEHLRHALESRIVIEQAKGIIARGLRVDMAAAFEVLRGSARRRRIKLHTLAADVVGGWIDPDDLAEG